MTYILYKKKYGDLRTLQLIDQYPKRSHFKNLTNLERSLNITDANYKNVRRAVANYNRLDARTKSQTLSRLKQMLQSKLPTTDIHKKFKEL